MSHSNHIGFCVVICSSSALKSIIDEDIATDNSCRTTDTCGQRATDDFNPTTATLHWNIGLLARVMVGFGFILSLCSGATYGILRYTTVYYSTPRDTNERIFVCSFSYFQETKASTEIHHCNALEQKNLQRTERVRSHHIHSPER